MPPDIDPSWSTVEVQSPASGRPGDIQANSFAGCELAFNVKSNVATLLPNQECNWLVKLSGGTVNVTAQYQNGSIVLSGGTATVTETGTVTGFGNGQTCNFTVSETWTKNH
jgi:hypothetical protein